MEKCLFSQASEELINNEFGIIYEGYKGTKIVEIYKGRRAHQVPVDSYRLEAKVYFAKDLEKKTILSLNFGYVATRSNKIAFLVSKLVKKPFVSVEQLTRIVTLAAQEERRAFTEQARFNYRNSQGRTPITAKKEWLIEIEKINPTQLKGESQ